VEVAEVVERRHLVGDRQLARLLEQAHVLEGERHRIRERLQPRERGCVEGLPLGEPIASTPIARSREESGKRT
jgi:hypothetical protein